MDKFSEFTDTYSDELIYLEEMRKSYLSHPGCNPFRGLFDASYFRIYCVFMVGNIESMIKEWRKTDSNGILNDYFKDVSNAAKIDALYENFQNQKINVDRKILDSYLALKYIRNFITHSAWNSEQMAFIIKLGFPEDTRRFTYEHLERLYHVKNQMSLYIAATDIADFASVKLPSSRLDVNEIFEEKDLIVYLWNNISRINLALTKNEAKLKDLKPAFLSSWKQFKFILADSHIDFDCIDRNRKILEAKIASDQTGQMQPVILKVLGRPEIIPESLKILEKVTQMNREELLAFSKAINQGERCYEIITNNSAALILKRMVDEPGDEGSDELTGEYIIAENLFILGRLYYQIIGN